MRAAAALFLALAACAPISAERAAVMCEERARAAAGPVGEVGIGVSSERGLIGKADITITTDYLRGRNPQVVYDQCVRQRTGQGPIRPLNLAR